MFCLTGMAYPHEVMLDVAATHAGTTLRPSRSRRFVHFDGPGWTLGCRLCDRKRMPRAGS